MKGRGTYPDDWPQLAATVKLEAGRCCVRCSAPDDQATGHVLTVHHFDGNRGNSARWNLIPLCQRCHLSVQNRVKPNQLILFRPAAWSMPYVAGALAAAGAPVDDVELAAWIREFETTRGPWPLWAPAPTPGSIER